MTYIIQGSTREYDRVADRDSTHFWLRPVDGEPVPNGYNWGGNQESAGVLALEHKSNVVNLAGKVIHTVNGRTKVRDIPHNVAYATPAGTVAAIKGRDEYTLIHVASGLTIPTDSQTGGMYNSRRVTRTKTLRDTKALALALEATGLLPESDDHETLRNADHAALKAFITDFGATKTEEKVAA